MGATEDGARGRAARPGGTDVISPNPPRAARVGRMAPFGIVALGTLAFVLGAGGTESTQPTLSSTAAAWRGLAGSARPQVDVGQRQIVVLKAPSLAQRVARAGGHATDSEERQWTTAALAAQQQVLATLAQHGVQVRVDYYYSRVINGFSAALDSEAVALLEREPEVAGVYPVRVAYPATVSSQLLAKDELARGAAHDPEIMLPGFDGRGVTIALLDTGVDRAQPFLRGRVQDGINVLSDGDFHALAATKPNDATRLERHGTEMAGLLVGAGGPEGLAGVATGATVLPIRVAGWQHDVAGGWAVYSRTDQLIAGLERAVDPNEDGDAHDAARIALVPLAAPYAAFADAPDARAVQGALALDTLVVAPAGNDGPGGPAFGSLSSPGGSPAALSVGAADLRAQTEEVRVVVRVGLNVLVDRLLPLAGAVLPTQARELALIAPEEKASHTGPGGFLAPSALESFFNQDGISLVAGRAALVRAGDDPVTAVENAARAGAAAATVAGAAALLAQARPDLDAQALRGVLAGYARPIENASVTSQGTGLVDVGAAAAAELAADPTSLAFGPAARTNWSSVQELTIRSLSTRRLYLR